MNVEMNRDQYSHDRYNTSQATSGYSNSGQGAMSTPNMSYIPGHVNNSQYGGPYHPTLGQMADQIQERARAEARMSGRSGSAQASAHGQDSHGDEYDDGGDGDGDGYDDDDQDGGLDDDPAGLVPAGNESTGRWTRAEHELFLQALKKYGKEWKKVASMVKTRTVVQTRTHAQKYFQKLTKTTPGGGGGGSMSVGGEGRGSGGSGGGGGNSGSKGLFYHKQGKHRGRDGHSSLSPQLDLSSPPGSALHPSMLVPPLMMHSYIPTTQGYGEIDAQDYYDSLDLVAMVGDLHKQSQQAAPIGGLNIQTPTHLSMGLPLLNTTSVGPPDFPEPSPAACGKRKHAELQAAQMLAASSSSKVRGEGATTSSGYNSISDFADAVVGKGAGAGAIKGQGKPGSSIVRESSGESAVGSAYPSRRNRLGLTLSIVDPNEGGAVSMNSQDPGTPWEAAIQVLEQQASSTAPMSRLMRSNSFSNYTMPAVPVSTPSEQRNFINKVRALVKDADLAGFASLLGAAEYSAQAMVKGEPSDDATGDSSNGTPATDGAKKVKTEGALGDQAPVSNLMSVYTPDATGKVRADSDGSHADHEPVTPHTAELRREEAINTQLNSSSGLLVEGSPRHRSASLVARSLNRIDRNARSVLMDIAATSDPSVNQTLLYSMCMLLMEHGAIPSLTDSLGNTALHYAAAQGHERIGRLLLTKGCPLNLQNMQGDTATHIAARHGHVAFIEMLADLGANFHIRNGASMCALDLLGNTATDSQRAHLRKLMLTAEPRLRTLVLYHEDFQEHTARRPSDWEGPDRLEAIMKRLRDKTEFPEHEVEISNRFEKADVELLGRVHSPEYIAFVNMLSKQVQQQEAADKDGTALGGSSGVLPFTPQVQRFVRRQHSEELKSSESCDTSFSVGTLSAARRAAGAVAFAVDRVMLGRNRNVFCAVRPPGHHAGYRGLLDGANSCGFCIFNNVAAGALHALVEHRCERVAIVDLDVHHGNGTEDIVRRYAHPSRLFFFSLHLYDKDEPSHAAGDGNNTSTAASTAPPTLVRTTTDRPIDAATSGAGGSTPTKRFYEFYPGTGLRDDHVHNIINVPLTPLWATDDTVRGAGAAKAAVQNPHGQFMGREGYRQAIEQRLIPSLRAFNPTLILLSIGFDAAAGDVGNCRQFPGEVGSRMGIDLQPEDFAWATTEVMKIADICCGGRLVSVLEGGYGEYAPVKAAAAPVQAPTTRGAAKTGGTSASNSGSTSAAPSAPESPRSVMNRNLLGKNAAAHVHRLMDPYGGTANTNGSSAPTAGK